MENIGIYYFTGTGNTKVVTEALKEALLACGIKVDLFSMEMLLKEGEDIEHDAYDTIGICYPIHGFGTPGIVEKFLKKLPMGQDKKVFLIQTAGDYGGINHNAGNIAGKKLIKKKYHVIYDRIIVMPTNFFLGLDETLSLQLYQAALIKVKDIAKDLSNGVSRLQKPSLGIKIFSSFVSWNENYFGARGFGLSLKADDTCTKCGLCIERCPMGNIRFRNDKIQIKTNCTWCMRCVYECPVQAIHSSFLKFSVLDEPYSGEDLLKRYMKEPNIGLGKKSIDEKSYVDKYNHFEQYLKDPSI